MARSDESRFDCEACGTSYRWKPELAGRKVKCKCGQVMIAPTEPSAAEEEDFGLYDLAEEPAPPQGKSLQQPPARMAPAVMAPAAAPAATSPPRASSRPQIAPPPPPVVSSAASAMYRAPAAPGVESNSAGIAKLAIALGLVVLLVGAVVVFRALLREDETAHVGDDATIVKMIRDQGGTEVIEWLQGDSRRMVMGMTNAQAEGRAKMLYDMGAKQVIAFGGRMTLSLAIELPDDPRQRKALFDWENQWHSEMMQPIATDVGQRYLLIKMRV